MAQSNARHWSPHYPNVRRAKSNFHLRESGTVRRGGQDLAASRATRNKGKGLLPETPGDGTVGRCTTASRDVGMGLEWVGAK